MKKWRRWSCPRSIVKLTALDLVYPPACVLCGAEPAGEFSLGASCRASLELLPLRGPACQRCGRPNPTPYASGLCNTCQRGPAPFARAASAARYGGAARELLLRYKLSSQVYLATSLGDLLDRARVMLDRDVDVVVPVPSHPRRERGRPYSAVGLLAREAARRWRLPCREGWLRRIEHRQPQGSLETRSRFENVKGAFAFVGARGLWQPRSPAGLRVLLVDDVYTSGSTARECARLLRRAGAREVFVATVARGALGSDAVLAGPGIVPVMAVMAEWEGDADCLH
jgi:ComF family protein